VYRTCNKHATHEKCVKIFLSQNMNGSLAVLRGKYDDNIKIYLKHFRSGMNFSGSGSGQMAGSCEQGK
jgi:hypothetical protein